MKDDSVQTIRRLEESLTDTSGESTAHLRKELESAEVDVNGFLARLKGVVRKGYQQQMRMQSEAASNRANAAAGSLCCFDDTVFSNGAK